MKNEKRRGFTLKRASAVNRHGKKKREEEEEDR